MNTDNVKEKEKAVKTDKTSNKVKTTNKDDIIIDSNMLNMEKKKEIPKRTVISIDNTIEDVIQYQDEGYSIFFADRKEEFLELTEDQIKELNLYNKKKYEVAKGIANKTLNLSSVKTSHMKFKPKASHASATNRLRVENKKSGKHYAWKRQDELQQVMYDGGSICLDPDVVTFGSFNELGKPIAEKDSTHYVQANGEIELVLTETPEETYKGQRDAIEERSVRQNIAVDNNAKAEIDALGGKTTETERIFNRKN